MQYATKGLHQESILEMNYLANDHATSLVELLEFLESTQPSPQNQLYQCPPAWRKFIQSLASSSPVCVLLSPDNSSLNLIKVMMERDIKDSPEVSNNFLCWTQLYSWSKLNRQWVNCRQMFQSCLIYCYRLITTLIKLCHQCWKRCLRNLLYLLQKMTKYFGVINLL